MVSMNFVFLMEYARHYLSCMQ